MSDGSFSETEGRKKRAKGQSTTEYRQLRALAVADFEDGGYTWWYAVPTNQKLKPGQWKRCTCRPLDELSRPPSDPGHPEIDGDVKWYRTGAGQYDVFPSAVFGEVTLSGLPDPSSVPSAGKHIWALSVFAHRDMEVLYQAFLAREAAEKQRAVEQRSSLPSQLEQKQPFVPQAEPVATEVAPVQELIDIAPPRLVEVAPGVTFVVSKWPTLPHAVAPLEGYRAVELDLPAEITTGRLFVVPDDSAPMRLPNVPCQSLAVGSIVWEGRWAVPKEDGGAGVRVVQIKELCKPVVEKRETVTESRTKRKRGDDNATLPFPTSAAARPVKTAANLREGNRAPLSVEAFRIGDRYYSSRSPLGPMPSAEELHGNTVSGEGHTTTVIGEHRIVVTTEGHLLEGDPERDGESGDDQSRDSTSSDCQTKPDGRSDAKKLTGSQGASHSVSTTKEARRGGGVMASQPSGSDAVMMDLLRCVEEVKKHCP